MDISKFPAALPPGNGADSAARLLRKLGARPPEDDKEHEWVTLLANDTIKSYGLTSTGWAILKERITDRNLPVCPQTTLGWALGEAAAKIFHQSQGIGGRHHALIELLFEAGAHSSPLLNLAMGHSAPVHSLTEVLSVVSLMPHPPRESGIAFGGDGRGNFCHPLRVAAEASAPFACLEMLIKAGADPNENEASAFLEDLYSSTPSARPLVRDKKLALLYEAGGTPWKYHAFSASVASAGRVAMVERCLQEGVDWQHVGVEPLIQAIMAGQFDGGRRSQHERIKLNGRLVADALLAAGCDINARNSIRAQPVDGVLGAMLGPSGLRHLDCRALGYFGAPPTPKASAVLRFALRNGADLAMLPMTEGGAGIEPIVLQEARRLMTCEGDTALDEDHEEYVALLESAWQSNRLRASAASTAPACPTDSPSTAHQQPGRAHRTSARL